MFCPIFIRHYVCPSFCAPQQFLFNVWICFVLFLGITRRRDELLLKLYSRFLVRLKNNTIQCCEDDCSNWHFCFLVH